MSLHDLFNYLWNTDLIILFYDFKYALRIGFMGVGEIFTYVILPCGFLYFSIVFIADYIKSKKNKKKKYPY